MMMGRAVSKKTLMVMANDADIPILAGDCCIVIKQYTKDGAIEIVSTTRKTLERVHQFIYNDDRPRPDTVAAAHPIFEGIEDRKLRALMTLFLGCDVHLKGMKGVTPKALDEKIIKTQYPKFLEQHPGTSLIGFLEHYMSTKAGGFDKEVMHTFIDALIYEPTNEVADPSNTDGVGDKPMPCRSYIDEPPVKLPMYLEEYAVPDYYTEIFDGPEIAVCKGVGARCHKFLCADGYIKCKSCDDIVCNHCTAKIEDNSYCLTCYVAELFVPDIDVEEGKTISDMREELASIYGAENTKDITVDEVEDMYALKEIATARIKKLFDDVAFPKFPSSELDAKVSSQWDTIMGINFGEGGAFISDPDLKPEYLPGILDLFSSLVRFESKIRTNWVKDPMVYDAMSFMFIDFVQKSRVDDGYRLLMRCVRHAFDSRCKSLDKVVGTLVLDGEGDVGVRIGSDVPASMKNNIYATEVVATARHLLCCKCTCQCGSQDTQNITCVHILVLLYLLTMLLMEDLAEHLLIALASRVSGSIDNSPEDDEGDKQNWLRSMSNWTDAEVTDIKVNIAAHMLAAGEQVTEHDKKNKELTRASAIICGWDRE